MMVVKLCYTMRLPKRREVEECKYTDEEINQFLAQIEPLIKSAVNLIPPRYRDDVAQDVRIGMWKNIVRFYDGSQDILSFARKLIPFELNWAFKTLIMAQAKHRNTVVYLEDLARLSVSKSFIEAYQHDMINMEKLRGVLKKNEFRVLEYLLKTGAIDDNFASISRQLGYKTVRSVQCLLNVIYAKIRDNFDISDLI
jgi:hypothetical protein